MTKVYPPESGDASLAPGSLAWPLSDRGELPRRKSAIGGIETEGGPRPTLLALLERRPAGATLCPSEVARAIAAGKADWRAAMPAVHEAVDSMVADGLIRLSWKGEPVMVRAGPYRIGRATG